MYNISARHLRSICALAFISGAGCSGTTFRSPQLSTSLPIDAVSINATSDSASKGASHAITARVYAIADDYQAARLAAYPELATYEGGPNARHDRLRDRSVAAERAWEEKEDKWLKELRKLDGQIQYAHPAWITYGMLRHRLESQAALRICQNRLWTVHPLTGWHSTYTALAMQQPVGTRELRAQTLARWRQFPRLIDQELANLQEGSRQGYTAPSVNVRRVLTTIDRLAALPVTQSPFYNPAARDSTPEFRSDLAMLVREEINPAIRRYRDYLATDYLKLAREDVAVTGNRDGEACYRAAIQHYTTLNLPGAELHQLGMVALGEAEAALTALAQEAFGSTDALALLRTLLTGA